VQEGLGERWGDSDKEKGRNYFAPALLRVSNLLSAAYLFDGPAVAKVQV